MRLEKREITLNERDSLKDALLLETALLKEYACSLGKAERKETRAVLVENMKETAEEIFLLGDLLKESVEIS
jgi:hypothetical protein